MSQINSSHCCTPPKHEFAGAMGGSVAWVEFPCATGPVPVTCLLRTRGSYSTTARAEGKKNWLALPFASYILTGPGNTRHLHMWKRWNGITASLSSSPCRVRDYHPVRDTGTQNFLYMAANQSWLGRSVHKILRTEPGGNFICDMPPFLITWKFATVFFFLRVHSNMLMDGHISFEVYKRKSNAIFIFHQKFWETELAVSMDMQPPCVIHMLCGLLGQERWMCEPWCVTVQGLENFWRIQNGINSSVTWNQIADQKKKYGSPPECSFHILMAQKVINSQNTTELNS